MEHRTENIEIGEVRNHYYEILSREFKKRTDRNKMYSLRAFAKNLGIPRSTLSGVLGLKRKLSPANAKKVNIALNIDPVKGEEYIRNLKNINLSKNIGKSYNFIQPNENEEKSLIDNWYYIAALNLAKLPENKSDPIWISKRLAISLDDAKDALMSLIEWGYISVVDGKMVRLIKDIHTSTDIPSESKKNYHKQNIEKALEAIDKVDLLKREISSMTFPIHTDQLEEAKEMIFKFKAYMASELKAKDPDEVYQLNIQFFPLTNQIYA